MKRLFLFVVLLFNFHFAKADQDCEAVDLRAKMGDPRDQDDTGWCYAHSAADLMSYKVGYRVSAFDVAVTSSFSKLPDVGTARLKKLAAQNPGIVERAHGLHREQIENLVDGKVHCLKTGHFQAGGAEEVAIALANIKGMCKEDKLEFKSRGLKQTVEEINIYVNQILTDEKARNDLLCKAPYGLPPLSPLDPDLTKKRVSFFYRTAIHAWTSKKCFPRQKIHQPIDPKSLYVTENASEMLKKYPKLKDRRKVQAKLFSIIDRRLSNRIPVAIGYNMSDLTEEGRPGNKSTKNSPLHRYGKGGFHRRPLEKCVEEEPAPADGDEDHSSIVAARKQFGGKCYYFVRNSYGKTCDGYRSELRCEKKFGGVWVKREDLPSIYSAVWVD